MFGYSRGGRLILFYDQRKISIPVRILLLVGSYWDIGGVQEAVDNLAAQFVHRGHAVGIITDRHAGGMVARAAPTDTGVVTTDIPTERPLTWRHPERLLGRSRGVVKAEQELAKHIGRFCPNVASSHEWLWDRFPGIVRACQAVGVPLVHTLYDTCGQGCLGKRALKCLKFAHTVVAVSGATRADFMGLLTGHPGINVIYPGVDIAAADAATSRRADRQYIFSAGRLLFAHKAMDNLIVAFSLIAARYPSIDLLVAGDGPDRHELATAIAHNGLTGRVQLLGTVSREELWGLHKGALLFVLPSRMSEGLGMVFLEAMACGKAVIASASGGVREIVLPGETGYLLSDEDPRTLASAMSDLLDRPNTCAQMGWNGRRLVRSRHTWASAADQYLDLYAASTREQPTGTVRQALERPPDDCVLPTPRTPNDSFER